ncbi:MAG: NAD-dependent epimerase/dehydratase family protein, partial [Planctomycetota bacterium]
ELAQLDVDVAHLTVPPDLHLPLARRLLELGIGVLVEKPMALSSSAVRELAELADARGLPLAVNHNNLFHPAFRRLLARVQSGEIGKVEHVQVTLSVPLRQLDVGDISHWMFRHPRNIVFEQATHPFSQLVALIGPVLHAETTLLGTRELRAGQPFHDRWLVAARAERGTAEVYLAFGESFTRSTLTVLGSDGSLDADLHHDLLSGERKTQWLDFWNSFLAGRGRGRSLKRDARRVLRGWLAFTLGVGPRRDAFYVGMRDSIRAFHSTLRAGRAAPADATHALAVAGWCEALVDTLPELQPEPPPLPPPGPARVGEIVITGATGFIGRRVVARLLDAGAHVTVVARRDHSLPAVIEDAAQDGRLRLCVAQLDDEGGLAAALEGAQVCLHLATGGGDTWEDVQRTMVGASRRLAELCLDARVRRFVYVSSVAALYTGPDAGVRTISDDHPTDPRPAVRATYARAKIATEAALRELAETSDLGLVIARPGVVLGQGTPMQHSGLGLWVRDNHCVGWGRGDHPLPLVWVEDVADALCSIALHEGDALHGKSLNLCALTQLTAAEVVAELAATTGRALHFHPRSLTLSQLMEVGKGVVKKVGRRPGARWPSYRDLKARSLAPSFSCEIARTVLGWNPVEERQAFLDRAVRVYGATR